MEQATRFCPNCGSPVSPGALFCDECGAKLPETAQSAQPVEAAQPVQAVQQVANLGQSVTCSENMMAGSQFEAPKKKKKTALYIGIAVALIIALVAALTILKSPKGIVDGEYTIIKEVLMEGGGGSSDSTELYDSGTITIDGLKESNGETGTITFDSDDGCYTGTLELSESEDYDTKYDVEWDGDAPEKSRNPLGYSAGSVNTEATWLTYADEEIKMTVDWTYAHILYYENSNDIYMGIDVYTIERK